MENYWYNVNYISNQVIIIQVLEVLNNWSRKGVTMFTKFHKLVMWCSPPHLLYGPIANSYWYPWRETLDSKAWGPCLAILGLCLTSVSLIDPKPDNHLQMSWLAIGPALSPVRCPMLKAGAGPGALQLLCTYPDGALSTMAPGRPGPCRAQTLAISVLKYPSFPPHYKW